MVKNSKTKENIKRSNIETDDAMEEDIKTLQDALGFKTKVALIRFLLKEKVNFIKALRNI